MDEYIRINARFPEAFGEEIKAYASQKGISMNEAIVTLAEKGLAFERDGIYASILASVIRSLMRAEMAAFSRDVSESVDMLVETAEDGLEEIKGLLRASIVAAIDAQENPIIPRERRYAYYKKIAAPLALDSPLEQADAYVDTRTKDPWRMTRA